MRFGHFEIFVQDLVISTAFYSALGFGVTQRTPTSVWLKLSSVEVLLRIGNPKFLAEEYRATDTAMVLYCDNLDEQLSRLSKHSIVPVGHDGSSREPTFKDPDGHWIQLVDPTDFEGC